MDAYLVRLPFGLASYPDCAIKGSILRTVLERKPPSRLSCAEATIFSPPWVFHELDHRATVLGIKAAIELAGARDVSTRLLETSATSAKLEVRWNRREG